MDGGAERSDVAGPDLVERSDPPHPATAGPPPSPDPPAAGTERLAAIEAELGRVERAIARLDEGSYGRCEVCGTPIDDELLAEDPLRSVCPGHLDLVTGA